MNQRVFVYGTLLRTEPNHRVMTGAPFLREARTKQEFTLLDLGPYPALREGGRTAVVGEVYEVSPEQLGALDRFEGVPRLYERVTIPLEDGETANAYVQRCAPCTNDIIQSGDWRAHRKERSYARTTAK